MIGTGGDADRRVNRDVDAGQLDARAELFHQPLGEAAGLAGPGIGEYDEETVGVQAGQQMRGVDHLPEPGGRLLQVSVADVVAECRDDVVRRTQIDDQ